VSPALAKMVAALAYSWGLTTVSFAVDTRH
jgi:hypothetical protein